jgi:hypothetical protein
VGTAGDAISTGLRNFLLATLSRFIDQVRLLTPQDLFIVLLYALLIVLVRMLMMENRR